MIDDKLDTTKIRIYKKCQPNVAISWKDLEDIIIPEVSSPSLKLSAAMTMTFAEKSYKIHSAGILYRQKSVSDAMAGYVAMYWLDACICLVNGRRSMIA